MTALHYCPSVMSLAVGYNLGTWSLLSLHTLQVERDTVAISVADPGSSAFLTLGWRKKNPDPRSRIDITGSCFRELKNNFFGLKLLKFCVADPDPGSGVFLTLDPPWMEKLGSGIWVPV